MLRVFIDSGSSIKQSEKEKYNVEIIPLKILLGDKEYQDSVDLELDVFYKYLENDKHFPKTSLPDLVALEDRVTKYTDQGDDVIIITISSKISGSYNSIRLMFEDNDKVHLIDSGCAVGGMRLIVDCINKNRDKSVEEILKIVEDFKPRIKIMAIPETLNYLLKGGRLNKAEWLLGTVLMIKPIIGFEAGKVKVLEKARGLKKGMKTIIEGLTKYNCDPEYDIIASYTKDKTNLDELIENTPDEFKKQINVYDNLSPSIAAHWGPNAFGYIFVSK